MPLNLDTVPLPRRRILWLLGCIAWFGGLCWWHRGVLVDDPWITFRYAQNVIAGNGWAFNPGEPLEGYSNFLWVLLAAAAQALRLDPLSVARGASVACVAAMLAAMALGLRRRDGEWLMPPSLAAAALAAGCAPLAVWAMGGLETAFHAALAFALVLALSATGPAQVVATAAALSALMLSRVEGPMWFALAAIAWFSPSDAGERRRLLAAIAIAAIVAAAYSAWRAATFGTLVPNTVSAKIGGNAVDAVHRGIAYAGNWFGGAPALLLVPVALALVKTRHRLFRLAACGAALQVAFAVAVGGDWMPASRFLVPAMPLLCLVAAKGMERWPMLARGAAVALFALAGLLHAKRDRELGWYRWAAKEGGSTVAPLFVAGRRLAAESKPGDVLAASEAGVMPYVSRLRFIDMLGLVDAHIAARGGFLHQQHDAGYVLSRNPDWIALVFAETPEGPRAEWPSDKEMAAHPGFASNYAEAFRIPRPLPDAAWGMRRAHLVLFRRTAPQ